MDVCFWWSSTERIERGVDESVIVGADLAHSSAPSPLSSVRTPIEGNRTSSGSLGYGTEKQEKLDERRLHICWFPTLYKVERGRHIHYCYNKNDLERLKKGFPPNASYNIQRFKAEEGFHSPVVICVSHLISHYHLFAGLGEMMRLQLWETTMDPARRLLKQLTREDVAEATLIFTSLMGDKVDTRKELILNFASRVNLQSLDLCL
ncbi:hypothetical protein GOP47_0000867 [Adiantum capillus-veneris]|uniref:DNA gyrase B subunit C-terminal domain-containing protein n=1 Tax=Adiantum capillus-veneris TaxID=13818 RepID=A0A9D4ZR43_ADICA|nr:hypothetical protein GOP47_0000867 [Adiantum capillus-veneris]